MKKYRIGEFAKYLGVTPDLLKYYEEMGIIKSHRSDSGYRFYQFTSAPALLESIRLRNYGMTLRDIGEVLNGSMPPEFSMDEFLERDMQLLAEEITLDQILIDDYNRFKRWKNRLGDRDSEWYIDYSPELYFLPHTNGMDFLADPRIYEILKSWMEMIPIVKSALYIRHTEAGSASQSEADKDDLTSVSWGFSVEKKYLESLHLPLNDAVIHIPSRKTLYYQFKKQSVTMFQETADNEDHPMFRLLRDMNLTPAGDYLQIRLMPSAWETGVASQYGYYAIPII